MPWKITLQVHTCAALREYLRWCDGRAGCTRELREFHGDQLWIGRDKRCELALPGDNVSRKHCLIKVHQGVAYAFDGGSTGGTRYRGELFCSSPTAIQPGEEFRIGDFYIALACLPELIPA